jgi:hypothetical protein
VRRLAAGTLLVVVLSGCAARQVVVPAPATDASLPAAERLLRHVSARRDAIHSLRTIARLAYTSPTEKRRAKQVILAARPDRLRFEVLSPFGPVFVLAASNGRLAAYARDEATVYRGAASPANLERYTSVELPITAAVDLLLGTPPIDDYNEPRHQRGGGKVGLGNFQNVQGIHEVSCQPLVSRDAGQVRLLCARGDGGARVVWFTPQLDPDRFEQWTANGDVVLRATFGQYADIAGVRLPLQLSLETPATQRRVDIELREPEVNPVLDEPLFALDTPRGSQEVDLDQGIN